MPELCKGYKQEFLLLSDVHFDNPYCRREILFDHLDEAKRRNAPVLSFGDFFCFMQGKYDPRRSKSSIRPEHNVSNYLDAVIADAANKLEPYKDQLLLFSDGNHETGILDYLETDPTQRFCDLLNMNGAAVHRGRYWGFVRFVFTDKRGGRVRSKTLFYHHGAWGGVITKGALSVARFASIVPDADIVYTGHTHDKWEMAHPRFHVRHNGQVELRDQIHLKGGTYKEEFLKGHGFASQKIVMPKSLGGHWIQFEYFDQEMHIHTEKTRINRQVLSSTK